MAERVGGPLTPALSPDGGEGEGKWPSSGLRPPSPILPDGRREDNHRRFPFSRCEAMGEGARRADEGSSFTFPSPPQGELTSRAAVFPSRRRRLLRCCRGGRRWSWGRRRRGPV